jgi:integrase/recombinase XerD
VRLLDAVGRAKTVKHPRHYPDVRRDSIKRVYRQEFARKRHESAPLLREREMFLTYLLRRGMPRERVQVIAAAILRAVPALRLIEMRKVTLPEIEEAIKRIWKRSLTQYSSFHGSHAAYIFRWAVRKWLRFHNCLKISFKPRGRSAKKLELFECFLRSRQLSESTIEGHCWHSKSFLAWLAAKHRPFARLSLGDVNKFLAAKRVQSGWSLSTLCSTAQSLKAFLRFSQTKGWCRAGFADAIRAPRNSKFSAPCQARKWSEVEKLRKSVTGNDHASIRARAALDLIVTYAFRSGEMARLRIRDFNWQKKTVSIRRSKNACQQRYPLTAQVAESVANYITARPPYPTDALFLTIKTPYRPVRRRSFYAITSHRLSKVGITSGKRGPHAIRHAKAIRLLHAGSSIREIGDFLGQRCPDSPLIYATFSIKLLRQVSDFKLGDLL